MAPNVALQLAEGKLSLSGIDLKIAKDLGIEVLTPEQTAKLGFMALPALKLNYFDPAHRPMPDWPGRPPFYRLRYLATPNTVAKVTDKKQQRYTQPPGTACCAYFPRTQDWHLLKDPDQPLIITEGEIKAACACIHGFPTIGVGGVYNWQSIPKGIELLPELEQIVWVKRHTYLCFDSDYLTNPNVCSALYALAQELVRRGAYVYITTIPSLAEGSKTGLDDYLMAQGEAEFATIVHASVPVGLTKTLFELNEKYVYVRQPGLVLVRENQAKVSPSAFKEHLEAPKIYHRRTLVPGGEFNVDVVSAAGDWLTWPLRSEATQLTYAPGQPERLSTGEYNSWPGWACQPKKGDVKPFYKLIDHLFTGAPEAEKIWFLRWLAYPLQHPGTKLFTSAAIHGRRTGTGKSLIGYTMGKIYGKNYTEISQADLHAGFNEWAEGKQLVMGDDVTGSNKRQDADLLKKLITQQEMRVNIKYVPSYTVPDRINYLFTSNHADVFFLEDDDRRFFIHEVTVGPLTGDFYASYAGRPGKPGWLDKGGAEAIFHHLLGLDLGNFDPAGHALRTQARDRMIGDVQSDLGGWVRTLLADPDQALRLGDQAITKDLLTNQELLALYDPTSKTGTTANGLGRELRRAGAVMVLGGKPIKIDGQAQARYYAVRNGAQWEKADVKQVIEHLTVAAAPVVKKKKF